MSNLMEKVPSMPYCLCHRKTVNSCMKEKREKRNMAYEQDIIYLTDNLRMAMIICGIPQEKACAAHDAIVRAFTHFDEIRYRVDRVPRKRLCKEDLIHDLGVQANMDRIEAQVTYSIVKRAFRAYFYGSSIHGRRMVETVSGMHHRSECLWAHAAKRTAQMLTAYYGLMYSEQKQYEERLQCVYKTLHDGLKANEIFDDDMICTCRPSERERISEGSQASGQMEVLFSIHEPFDSKEFSVTKGFQVTSSNDNWRGRQSQLSCPGQNSDFDEEQKLEIEEEHDEADKHCQCKPLTCANVFERGPPHISADCSQGPFSCRWLPMSEEDRVPPCKPEPPPKVCPPCKESDVTPCDSECECICEFCECEVFDMAIEEEARNLKLSEEGIEDNDTDFTFVAPLRDPASETTSKSESKKDGEEVAEEQPANDSECKCVCKYKLGYVDPEDINYVAPLKDNPPEQAEEEGEEESELAEPRKPILVIDLPPIEVPTDPITPPSGIQLQTAQCWMDPKYKPESSSISVLSESEPPLPPGLKPAGCRAMAEQKRMIEKLRAEQPPPPQRPAGIVHVTLGMALEANPKHITSAKPLPTITVAGMQRANKPNSTKPAEPLPNITVASTHGPNKAPAPANRYKESPVSSPKPQTTQSTVRPQTTQSAVRPQPPARRVTPPPAQNKTKPSPPASTQPLAKPNPPTEPTNRRQSQEPTLTKEDVLNIIGL